MENVKSPSNMTMMNIIWHIYELTDMDQVQNNK